MKSIQVALYQLALEPLGEALMEPSIRLVRIPMIHLKVPFLHDGPETHALLEFLDKFGQDEPAFAAREPTRIKQVETLKSGLDKEVVPSAKERLEIISLEFDGIKMSHGELGAPLFAVER